ncbi:MAG TPA: 50S ribosomal protein L24 [Candidatus Dormibacteraeota bacterium]|nr:50S ribosomal protein L24 [Candidatus Dormibacteraeota bacterium]
MPAVNVKRGDTVLILSGKDKGKRGTVKAVFPKEGTATVEGLNIVKRHTKQRPTDGAMSSTEAGGIIEKEAPLRLSKLMYVCSKCQAPTRTKSEVHAGSRERVCRRCGEVAERPGKG